jgi:hypothetical protein
MLELGELRSVSIREVWPLEPQHFSAWLAENLSLLGRAVGIELELRRREVGVGTFSLDILAHDVYRDRVVIIENQLSRTDHDHLGKLITYAAGLKAFVVIWISPEFREEHRAAVEWLNENTDETKEFFAIQIEALKIDNSRPAANFKLISYPNDWQKTTSASAQQGSDNPARRAFFLEYFTELSAAARQAGFERAQAASGQPDLVLARLSSGSYIATGFSMELLTLGLYIARNDAVQNKRIYEVLSSESAQIEQELGVQLKWDYSEGRVRQQIWTSMAVDRENPLSLDSSRRWAIETAKKFRDAFGPRLIRLAPNEAGVQ